MPSSDQMALPQITVVHWEDGDWFELYADGERVGLPSNHRIRNEDILEALGVSFERIHIPATNEKEGFYADEFCGHDSLQELVAVLEGAGIMNVEYVNG
jgi:hypothetical protein